MPCCRHNSAVFAPLSPCFRIAMTCSSLWRVPRILCSPFLRPENYHPSWIQKWGPGQLQRDLLDLVAQFQIAIGRLGIGLLPVPARAAHLAQFAHPFDAQTCPCLCFFFDVLVEAAPVLSARSRRCSSTCCKARFKKSISRVC